MKRKIALLLVLKTMCVSAQMLPPEHQWTATLKTIDECGKPVSGATVWVGYDASTNVVSGITGANGIFIASHRDGADGLTFHAEKHGYYPFLMSYYRGGYNPNTWDIKQVLLLKRVINPIAMYAKQVRTHVPELDKTIGYDLSVGDWVAPYGRGDRADMLFTAHFDKPRTDETDFTLTVSFANQGDGLQEFKTPTYYLGSQGSALLSSERAPTNGYQAQWVQIDNRKNDEPTFTNRDLNRNYYFRVQTVLDHDGNVVSTHYGKIYGDFMTFRYYLNPTPNDPNVEFDVKQNMIKNLKFDENVDDP